MDIGASSTRFDDIFATNGTINTSDRNEKQDIEALSDAEQRVAVAAKGLIRKYRWKSKVAEKGDDPGLKRFTHSVDPFAKTRCPSLRSHLSWRPVPGGSPLRSDVKRETQSSKRQTSDVICELG